MQSLEDFVRHMLAAKMRRDRGIPDYKLRDKMLPGVVEELNDFIHRYIVESMDPATRERLGKFLATDPPHAEVQRFMDANAPNKDQLIVEAIAEFRKGYLGY